MSIVAEAPGFLQVFSDGSVKRFAPQVVDASEESSKGYRFKDVVIDPSKPITGRIFLPDTPRSTTQLLPLVVYFHGGGFCFGSTTWAGYHYFLGDFSVASQSIVVSVDYRLAPENRLPVAYEDCYSSLEWLSHQVSTEPWLSGADLSRVFLSGDSAGGNIAHNVAVKYICEQINNVKIRGLVLIHPYFGSEKRTEEELDEGAAGHVASNDMFWGLSIPEGSNRDYFGCNVEKAELSESQWSQFPAVMVHVAGLDFLKQRGVMYVEFPQSQHESPALNCPLKKSIEFTPLPLHCEHRTAPFPLQSGQITLFGLVLLLSLTPLAFTWPSLAAGKFCNRLNLGTSFRFP